MGIRALLEPGHEYPTTRNPLGVQRGSQDTNLDSGSKLPVRKFIFIFIPQEGREREKANTEIPSLGCLLSEFGILTLHCYYITQGYTNGSPRCERATDHAR